MSNTSNTFLLYQFRNLWFVRNVRTYLLTKQAKEDTDFPKLLNIK